MIPGFHTDSVSVGAVRFHVQHAGRGDTIMLLHGFPETSYAWRRVAPVLAERFRVIVPDLPGYGLSSIENIHEFDFSKRSIGPLIVKLVEAMGHQGPFHLAGHDRGARVAYRLAIDDSHALSSLAILGITPTGDIALPWSLDRALGAYHWFFLSQPYPLPERLIESDVEFFIRHTVQSWSGNPELIDEDALRHYARAFRNPEVLHAACQGYRAGVTADLEHDLHDRQAGNRLTIPVLFINPSYDAQKAARRRKSWQNAATNLFVQEIRCGHFIMEEAPAETAQALREFFAKY
jgi:haloacetate dehalogenase